MSLMTAVEPPTSLTERAVAAIRRDILVTRAVPGAALSEASLAEALSLGKAPVRAALARLAEEGLVTAIPRRGWVVSLVTIRDIHEVFDLRLLLEPEAARRAAGRVDAAELHRLDAVCAAGYRPEDGDSAAAFLAANKPSTSRWRSFRAMPGWRGRSTGCSMRARACSCSACAGATAVARWRMSTRR